MQFGQSQTQKKPVNQSNDSVVESLRGITSTVGNTVKNELVGQSISDAFAALLGNYPQKQESYQQSAPVRPVVPEIAGQNQEKIQPVIRRPEILSTDSLKREQEFIRQQIESVRMELKALVASLKSLNAEVEKAIADSPVEPGVYHMNFFERLKTLISAMRKQVNQGRSWLNLFQTRKKAKGYWNMYKKHGTTFGLSSERSLASQAG